MILPNFPPLVIAEQFGMLARCQLQDRLKIFNRVSEITSTGELVLVNLEHSPAKMMHSARRRYLRDAGKDTATA